MVLVLHCDCIRARSYLALLLIDRCKVITFTHYCKGEIRQNRGEICFSPFYFEKVSKFHSSIHFTTGMPLLKVMGSHM